MKRSVIYLSLLFLTAVSALEAQATQPVTPYIRFGVISLYEKMEKEHRLNELSANFKKFYAQLKKGDDKASVDELTAIVIEAKSFGMFTRGGSSSSRNKVR